MEALWQRGLDRLGSFPGFLAIKLAVALSFGFPVTGAAALLLTVTAIWAALAALLGRPAVPLAVLAVLATVKVVWRLPLTINHSFLELYFVLLVGLTCWRGEEVFPLGDGLRRQLRALFLAVWFFAGLQKWVHGVYLSGEYFLLDGRLLGWVGGLLGQKVIPLARPEDLAHPFAVLPAQPPAWCLGLAAVLGFAVVVGEMALPILVATTRLATTHRLTVPVLVAAQLAVALPTGEWDFAFLGLACAGLWLERGRLFWYGGLAAAYPLSWMF